MKRFIAVLVLAMVCVAFVSAQGFTGEKAAKGGFSDGTNAPSAITTVEKALNMRDDTHATLRGNIVRQIRHEKYLFKDATGEIVVEIDDDDWGGVTVGPNDTVELIGEIDRDINKIEFDVDIVKKVQ
ncbi:MAG: YgiW/YdeI family stress tolerance OB fold protein [Spirochaetia bacterium]|nr:YgiW/YdeI family stress tolerance OB fold protein [Spirochaetia bacterium]